MAENRNLGGQNPNKVNQQGDRGTSRQSGNESFDRDLRQDEDLQQDVSIGGGSLQSDRLGREGSDENLENQRMGSDRGNLGGNQSGSTQRGSSGSGSNLGSR